MTFPRRDFLKIAGFSALAGMGGVAAWELIGPGKVEAEVKQPNPRAALATHWGLAVDLRKIKSQADTDPMVKACHQAHNVPEIATKQNIKWIWATDFKHAFTHQENKFLDENLKKTPVPVLCNHCENPPCVRVCPTKATFKREQDGIVLMDFHRCIGCRFCMAACPYGSRSFNFGDPREYLPKVPNPRFPTRTKGVVEKCNFCAERLAQGQIPACVEAAKDGQLLFGDLDDPRSAVRHILRKRYSIRRKPDLGTGPSIYYLV